MKIKEIVRQYEMLGKIQVYNLEDEEIVTILNARFKMKQHVDEYNSFLEDAKEKCKPIDYDEKSTLMTNWDMLDESMRKELNKWLREYNNKINNVVKDFADKDVELEIEKLDSSTAVKILKGNSWQPNKLDDISIIL